MSHQMRSARVRAVGPKRRHARTTGVLVASLLAAAGCASPLARAYEECAQRPRVAVASSAAPAVAAIVKAASWSRGCRPRLDIAATGRLARQIEAGAPDDVLIAADTRWVDYLVERRLALHQTRRVLATNELVIATRRDSEGEAARPLSERSISLRELPFIGRVALAGATVPLGRYSREALANELEASALAALMRHTVEGTDARATLAWVVAGQVDAAVVYASDARWEPRLWVSPIDASLYPPIRYEAIVVRESPASALVEAMQSARGQRLLRRFGLRPHEGPSVGHE